MVFLVFLLPERSVSRVDYKKLGKQINLTSKKIISYTCYKKTSFSDYMSPRDKSFNRYSCYIIINKSRDIHKINRILIIKD
jgi:hypothetical protein